MFNLSPIYSSHKSSNQKFPPKHKTSPDTNLPITKRHTHNFPRISPFGIAPVKKAQKARKRWYRGPCRPFINTRLKKAEPMACHTQWDMVKLIFPQGVQKLAH